MRQIKQKENKLKLINAVLFCMLVIFSVSYLLGTNDVAIKSYVMQQKKKAAKK